MAHHIDISNVLAVEVGPVAPDLFSTLESKRHSRRIVVRTRLGVTTIILHAASASDLEVSVITAPGPASG
jgi:hypothetical protein